MNRLCLLILALLILSGTSGFSIDKVFSGKGSWYGDKFHGRKTASGERYDVNKYTAAHKTLPFGTILKVTNKSNGKSVVVRVNDRGPFVKNRVIDLSKKAAQDLGYLKTGIADLKIEIVSLPGEKEKDSKEIALGPVGQEADEEIDESRKTDENKENKEGIAAGTEKQEGESQEKSEDIDGIMDSLQSDLKGEPKKKDENKENPVLKEKDSKEVLIDFDKSSADVKNDGHKKDFEGVYQIFVVQLGAFSSEEKAISFQKKLSEKGIESYVAKVDRDSMTLYKVREKTVYRDLNKVKERWHQIKKMGLECFVIGKYFFGS